MKAEFDPKQDGFLDYLLNGAGAGKLKMLVDEVSKVGHEAVKTGQVDSLLFSSGLMFIAYMGKGREQLMANATKDGAVGDPEVLAMMADLAFLRMVRQRHAQLVALLGGLKVS